MINTNKTSLFTAVIYYCSSLVTLFKIRNILSVPAIFFKKPFKLILKNGLSFFVDSIFDVWLLKEVILDRQYTSFKNIKKGSVVIDIGSGIGDFSISSASNAGMVYSFEADPGRIGLMEKNLKLNEIKNIKLIPGKVSSLDYVISQNSIARCDFLKIDCEGSEYQIFENASSKTLSKIDYIAMEIHLFDSKMKAGFLGLKQKLEKNSFSLKVLDNPVHNYIKFLFAERK